jgi:transcriptional regulator with XRE-family HTH domain
VADHDPERLVTNVGRRIAELRRKDGRTQEELAEALRMTVQYLQRIEAGMNLTLHSLSKIARALKVPVTALFAPPKRTLPARAGRPPKRRARRSSAPTR